MVEAEKHQRARHEQGKTAKQLLAAQTARNGVAALVAVEHLYGTEEQRAEGVNIRRDSGHEQRQRRADDHQYAAYAEK